MPNYFIDSSCVNGRICSITGNDFYHLMRVRRVSKGDALTLVDENSRCFSALVEDILPECIICSVELMESAGERPFQLCLYAALLKGKKFDLVIRKAVETGIHRIVPVITERCIVDYSEKAGVKNTRWRRIAEEAAKQSLRRQVPDVTDIRAFDDVIYDKWDERIIAHVDGDDFKMYARSVIHPRSAAVIVGPEGGFSESELEAAEKAGWKRLALSFPQMRAETAAIVTSALMTYEWGSG